MTIDEIKQEINNYESNLNSDIDYLKYKLKQKDNIKLSTQIILLETLFNLN
jgi:hypothetical protein